MRTSNIIRIIACNVFEPALNSFQLERRYPDVRVTYLPANLHLRPQDLENRLREEVFSAQRKNERVICLYGDCFPGIDDFCEQYGVTKVPGHYCYEMLLGSERFKQYLNEMTGTYFAEKNFILNFEEYCLKPLELDDEEMRTYCFGRYRRLLYLRQPSDPDLAPQASKVANFLGLSLDYGDVDYSYLEKELVALL